MWYVRAGSKVTGPFSEDYLLSLRKRGQFSPIHQVSTDRVRWESAASLVKLLDGKKSDFATPPESGNSGTSDHEQASDPESRWYYLDGDQQKNGPLTPTQLKRLVQSGSLSPQTLVCARGDSEWVAIAQHPTLGMATTKSRFWILVAITLVGLLVVGISAALIIRNFSGTKSAKTNTTDDSEKDNDENSSSNDDSEGTEGETTQETSDGNSSGSKDPLLITSLKNEDRIKQAIGLVVSGVRLRTPEGKVVEKPIGTGSCFAISSSGHLLTNRHVVADYAPPKDSTVKTKTGETIPVVIDQPIVVFFNRIRFEAKVLHIDKNFDLAVLKIERLRPQPYFALSNKNEFHRGNKCFALGFPGVANNARSEEEEALLVAKSKNDSFETILLDQNFEYSYQGGEISRVIRDAKRHSSIEHSATIFPGNSGGPLVDSRCTVIGINTLLAVGKTGSLPVAFATGQFKNTVDEFTGGICVWRD